MELIKKDLKMIDEKLHYFFTLEAQYSKHVHFKSKIVGLSPALHIAKIIDKNTLYYVCYDLGIIVDGAIEKTEEVKDFLYSQIVEYLLYYFLNNKMEKIFKL